MTSPTASTSSSFIPQFLGYSHEGASLYTRPSPKPEEIKALRIRLHATTPVLFHQMLERLTPFLKSPSLQQALIQIQYYPHQVTPEYAQIHQKFKEQWTHITHTQINQPQISTYLPLCFESIHGPSISQWATPKNCTQCIYRQANVCQGLGQTPLHIPSSPDPLQNHPLSSFSYLEEIQSPLQKSWSTHPTLKDFQKDPPLAYWIPQAEHLSAIQGAFQANHVKTIWDLGGGNGFLAWCLAQWGFSSFNPIEHQIVIIDPLSVYETPSLTHRWQGITEEFLHDLPSSFPFNPPDAFLISWPNPGRSESLLIEKYQPKVIIRAYDDAGVCGIRRASYGLEIQDQNWIWWGWGNDPLYDDLDFDPQRPYIHTWSTMSYRDCQSPLSQVQGRLSLFSSHPWTPQPLSTPLPWGVPLKNNRISNSEKT